MIKNSQGFSLVSVMVAASIAGVVALLVMKLAENLKEVESRSASVMDAREMLSEMRSILENEKNCKLSLQLADGEAISFNKSEIDELGKDQGLPIELWIGNAQGTKRITKKFSEGAELGKTKINSIRLFMNNGSGSDYPAGPKSDLGTIRVSYSFQSSPQKTLFRDFLINVDFVTSASGLSQITGCERSGIKSLCESLSLQYNPETQRCYNPPETCDEMIYVAPEGNWSGWKMGECQRLAGGYIQSIIFGQNRNGPSDSNSLRIKCCYSQRYEHSTCSSLDVAPESWWVGSKSGVCNERPGGFMRKIEFYQGNDTGKDTNGMKVQCCYPN